VHECELIHILAEAPCEIMLPEGVQVVDRVGQWAFIARFGQALGWVPDASVEQMQ
jgi:hypothetical protein